MPNYDKIADHYHKADFNGAISCSQEIVLKQLEEQCLFTESPITIVDIGAGDGKLLSKLQPAYKQAKMYAVDNSKKMLELIKTQSIKKVHSSATDIDQHFAENSVDIIFMHFVFSYVSVQSLLQQCYRILKKGGYLSIVTTTKASYPNGKKCLKSLEDQHSLFSFIATASYKKILNSIQVPENYDDMLMTLKSSGYTILTANQSNFPFKIDSVEHYIEVSKNGGWFSSFYDQKYIPKSVLTMVSKKIAQKFFTLPFEDKSNVLQVLCQKNKG